MIPKYNLRLLAVIVLVAFAVFIAGIGIVNAKPDSPETNMHQYIHIPKNAGHLNGTYNRGIAHGNREGVFSKIGDSTVAWFWNLAALGFPEYTNLGEYGYLQSTVDFYRAVPVWNTYYGRWENSWNRPSMGAAGGMHSGSFLSITGHENSVFCVGRELMPCEYDEILPSIALIQVGTNDLSTKINTPLSVYESNLRQMIEYTLGRDIVPVLYTIQPRCDKAKPYPQCREADVQAINTIIWKLAEEYRLPLIDMNSAINLLPNYGLTTSDWLHISGPSQPHLTGNFTESYLQQYAYNRRNLLTLIMLDELHKILK